MAHHYGRSPSFFSFSLSLSLFLTSSAYSFPFARILTFLRIVFGCLHFNRRRRCCCCCCCWNGSITGFGWPLLGFRFAPGCVRTVVLDFTEQFGFSFLGYWQQVFLRLSTGFTGFLPSFYGLYWVIKGLLCDANWEIHPRRWMGWSFDFFLHRHTHTHSLSADFHFFFSPLTEFFFVTLDGGYRPARRGAVDQNDTITGRAYKLIISKHQSR